MKTIILADRKDQELAPLTDDCAIAMLPVAGRPIIEHTIDALFTAGIREVLIVSQPNDLPELSRHLGAGERWGMNFEYATDTNEVGGEHCLVIRGDVLRDIDITDFLNQALSVPSDNVTALTESGAAWLEVCRHFSPDVMAFDKTPLTSQKHTVKLAGAVYELRDWQNYFQANLDAGTAKLKTLHLASMELAPGLLTAPNGRISPASLKSGQAFIGFNSMVHPRANLMEDVVVSSHAMVGKYVSLRHCLVMPGTYIREGLSFHNAIISGDYLIRIDFGVIVSLAHRNQLARLNNIFGSSLCGWLGKSNTTHQQKP